eukprot:1137662-Pelagomonas_calceolata.AAC.14
MIYLVAQTGFPTVHPASFVLQWTKTRVVDANPRITSSIVVDNLDRLPLFPAEIGTPVPAPRTPQDMLPMNLLNHRCRSSKPGGCYLRTPFWQGF